MVGIARARARILKVDVEERTASSAAAQQPVPAALRDCLVERLRTQEWELSGPAQDQVHMHMTALNWR